MPIGESAKIDSSPVSDSLEQSGAIPVNLEPVHLSYLDGIRGLAAFCIVIYHIVKITGNTQTAHIPNWFFNFGGVKYGYIAVDVFIVLSGFCLMLPISKAGLHTFPRGTQNFLWRRARRILPPYYAALALSVVFLLAFPSTRYLMPNGLELYNLYDRSSFLGSFVSHLFLVHNLSWSFVYRLNGPMWSVATEWQIYFVFAFVLLPLRNRLGPIVPIVLGFLFGALTLKFGLEPASFWYVGSFAIGMAASDISFLPRMADWRKRAPLGMLTVAILLVSLALFSVFHHLPGEVKSVGQDLAAAGGIAAIIAYCAIRGQNSDGNFHPGVALYRVLSHPLLVGLGRFSYSLYLIHFPLVCMMLSLSTSLHLTFHQVLAFVTLLVLPVVLGASYLFYTVFERPFLNSPQTIAKES